MKSDRIVRRFKEYIITIENPKFDLGVLSHTAIFFTRFVTIPCDCERCAAHETIFAIITM